MLFDPQRTKAWTRWIYGGLAVIFIVSFVIGGVGSGNNFGLSDIFGSGSSSGSAQPAGVAAAQRHVRQAPSDPAAWTQLAQAYQSAGEPARAVTAYEKAANLAPNDVNLAQNLALAYDAQASSLTSQASALQQQAQALQQSSGGASPLSGTAFDSNFGNGVLQMDTQHQQTAVSQVASQASSLQSQASAISRKEVRLLEQLVAKPTVKRSDVYGQLLLRLGSAAETAQELPIALDAFRTFLKAEPQAVEVPQVRQIVKQLKAQVHPAASGATTTTSGG